MSASPVHVDSAAPAPKPEAPGKEQSRSSTACFALAEIRYAGFGCATRSRCPGHCYPELELLGRRARRTSYR